MHLCCLSPLRAQSWQMPSLYGRYAADLPLAGLGPPFCASHFVPPPMLLSLLLMSHGGRTKPALPSPGLCELHQRSYALHKRSARTVRVPICHEFRRHRTGRLTARADPTVGSPSSNHPVLKDGQLQHPLRWPPKTANPTRCTLPPRWHLYLGHARALVARQVPPAPAPSVGEEAPASTSTTLARPPPAAPRAGPRLGAQQAGARLGLCGAHADGADHRHARGARQGQDPGHAQECCAAHAGARVWG